MNSPKSRVRLIDIANRAKVSPMTVAAVLNGAGGNRIRVSQSTAGRVRQIAEELGFLPNMAAQQLAGMPSRVIGVIAKSWFTSLPLKAMAWLSKFTDLQDYRIITSETQSSENSLAKYLRECDSRGVDGLIYFAREDESLWPKARELFRDSPRVVSIMGDPGIPHGSCVLSDFAGGVKQAVKHLHQQGRQRIVQILEDLDIQANRQRRLGMIEAFEECGLEFTDQSICIATKGWEPNSPNFGPLAEELINQKIDALIADSDTTAIVLMNEMRRRGVEPGREIAVIGWGHEVFGYMSYPQLTTVQFHMDQVCSVAVQTILDQLASKEQFAPRRIIIPTDLVVRESA